MARATVGHPRMAFQGISRSRIYRIILYRQIDAFILLLFSQKDIYCLHHLIYTEVRRGGNLVECSPTAIFHNSRRGSVVCVFLFCRGGWGGEASSAPPKKIQNPSF